MGEGSHAASYSKFLRSVTHASLASASSARLMGKCHALAWNAVRRFGDVRAARVLAEASQELAERKAHELGFARATGDWRSLVDRP